MTLGEREEKWEKRKATGKKEGEGLSLLRCCAAHSVGHRHSQSREGRERERGTAQGREGGRSRPATASVCE